MATARNRSRIAAALALGVLALAVWAVLRPQADAAAGAPRTARRGGRISDALRTLDVTGHGVEAIRVPAGFEVSEAIPPGMVSYPMFLTFDDRRRLFVCESAGKKIDDEEMSANPLMRVRLLEDTDGDGVF